MKKIVIGFAGEKNVGKTTAANILEKKGFLKLSISSKVEEFASYLCSENELENNKEEILKQIRKRGQAVLREYWLNQILSGVSDDHDFMVFDDIDATEATSRKIKVYHIYRPGISTVKIPNIEEILNDGSKEDFIQKINALFKKLKK